MLLSNRENLNVDGRVALKHLLAANKRLNTAYLRKESFGQLWDYQCEGWARRCYIYAISVPTVIDRSLSFYILEKIQQQGGGVRMDRFEEIFTKGYAQEHQLVAVRLTEQQSSGTVVIGGGCVRLTERGHRLADFSHWFRKYLLRRQRLLMGTYTDELTDPFRSCAVGSDAGCQ